MLNFTIRVLTSLVFDWHFYNEKFYKRRKTVIVNLGESYSLDSLSTELIMAMV